MIPWWGFFLVKGACLGKRVLKPILGCRREKLLSYVAQYRTNYIHIDQPTNQPTNQSTNAEHIHNDNLRRICQPLLPKWQRLPPQSLSSLNPLIHQQPQHPHPPKPHPLRPRPWPRQQQQEEARKMVQLPPPRPHRPRPHTRSTLRPHHPAALVREIQEGECMSGRGIS